MIRVGASIGLAILIATLATAQDLSAAQSGPVAVAATPTAPTSAPPAAKQKNWIAPAGKRLYVQTLTEQVMAAHPELISITFHGVPPGAPAGTYTMFGGSYPDRIGNPDDPDDIMIIETGITILDPRWHRTHDAVRKFVVMLPLRDATQQNIGLLVLAYKNPITPAKSDQEFLAAGTSLRDQLAKQIANFAALFAAPH